MGPVSGWGLLHGDLLLQFLEPVLHYIYLGWSGGLVFDWFQHQEASAIIAPRVAGCELP